MRAGGGGRRRIDKETGESFPAESFISKISANPISYLCLRELLLHDWSMANFLCTKCDHYRRECTCKKPKFLVFAARHQAQAGGKRRREGEESYTTRRRTKEERCQYGCGATFSTLKELFDHEPDCEVADEYKRMTGPKPRLRTWEKDGAQAKGHGNAEGWSDDDEMQD